MRGVCAADGVIESDNGQLSTTKRFTGAMKCHSKKSMTSEQTAKVSVAPARAAECRTLDTGVIYKST